MRWPRWPRAAQWSVRPAARMMCGLGLGTRPNDWTTGWLWDWTRPERVDKLSEPRWCGWPNHMFPTTTIDVTDGTDKWLWLLLCVWPLWTWWLNRNWLRLWIWARIWLLPGTELASYCNWMTTMCTRMWMMHMNKLTYGLWTLWLWPMLAFELVIIWLWSGSMYNSKRRINFYG